MNLHVTQSTFNAVWPHETLSDRFLLPLNNCLGIAPIVSIVFFKYMKETAQHADLSDKAHLPYGRGLVTSFNTLDTA